MTQQPAFTDNDKHALRVLRKFLGHRTKFEDIQNTLRDIAQRNLMPYPKPNVPNSALPDEVKALLNELDQVREQIFASEKVLLAWHRGENVVLARLAIL